MPVISGIFLFIMNHEEFLHIRAKKSLGQNFLIDEGALFDISHSIQIEDRDIIEVWPGYGALTDYIITQNPQQLHLLELDSDMIELLEKRKLTDWKDVCEKISIHHQDVLKYRDVSSSYSVIANIPYYITSPILFHFLYTLPISPNEMVIMMQKEVGEKIISSRWKKIDNSFLSLAMQYRCESIDAVRVVPKESFRPSPKVESIVLRFIVKNEHDKEEEKRMLDFWKYAFRFPRKTLYSNLWWYHGIWNAFIKEAIIDIGYDEKVRPEAIEFNDWFRLYTRLFSE